MEHKEENLSRRELLKTGLKAGTAIAAATILPNIPSAVKSQTGQNNPQDLKKYWTDGPILPKDFSKLVNQPPQGMSSRQIREHLGLYKKYVTGLNKVHKEEKSTGINHNSLTNKGFAYGGTVLHELYFSNLAQTQNQLNYKSELMNALGRQYGAYEGFVNNFKAAGKSSRGWTILGLSLFDGNLDIYGLDAHNEGTMLGYVWPVVVMDVYEHAYMIDHGTNKPAYINDFVNNIDWRIAEARFNQGLKNIENSKLII